jgi:hypothetical protein
VGANGGFGSWHHLAKRFFGALSPVGPAPADEEWAQSHLLNGERTVWRRMSGPDRRHAVGVARDAIRLLQPAPAPREVVAAALLHDSGKVESSLGTFMRAGVTFIAVVVGRTRLLRWAGDLNGRRSWRARIGLYLTHDRVGADLLDRAGSHPLTVSWTSEHHMAPELWTVDATVGAALKAADGD